VSALDDILGGVRSDLDARMQQVSLDELKVRAQRLPACRNPVPVLRKDGVAVIAEVKRSSPSKGALAAIADPAALALDYELGGARVISVLTEQRRGLTAFVECHTIEEAVRAVDAGARIVGVNARDLNTLEVDRSVFAKVAPHIPDSVLRVAESGVRGPHDVIEYARAGADAVLVGESLVTGRDPRSAVADLVAAGAHPAVKHDR
jgi:indole-3-glycerol phosphate synthase